MSLHKTLDRMINHSPNKTFLVSNATLLAAGNPTSSLAAGQFGVFVYDATDLRFESKTTAFTDANINAQLKAIFAQGYTDADGAVRVKSTMPFSISDVRYQKKVYTAPTKAQRAIGYNGTTGSLNFSSVVEGDEYLIKIIRTSELTFPDDARSFAYKAKAGDIPYTVMSYFAKTISDDTNPTYNFNFNKRLYRAELLTSLSGSQFGGSATIPSTVKGSTTQTTNAGHGVGVGDYVSILGDVYKAVAGTTGTTLVLDRPYSGANGALIDNVDLLDLGATAPTAAQMGLRITAEDNYETFALAVSGQLEGSTLSELAVMTSGSGVALFVSEREKAGFIEDGFLARHFMASDFYPQPTATTNGAAFYSLYSFSVRPSIAKDFSAAKQTIDIYVQQTDASTPSAFNAAFDTLLGAIPTFII